MLTTPETRHLLNTDAGMMDLRTGTFCDPDASFSPAPVVHLVPDRSGCPTWLRFLDDVFEGEEDLIHFVQKAVGYTLTGDTREQVLFWVYGAPKTGKSTFLDCLHHLAGEYSRRSEISILMEGFVDAARDDLARLHASRLVTATAQARVRFDASSVKSLTGADMITARFPHQQPVAYKPAFKIWLASTKRPRIRGNDAGLWRRILKIPFNVVVSNADVDLGHKLENELPGIFQWAIDGAKCWYQEGLRPPPICSS